jgi:DNA repair protein SbcD/Mre11
MRLLHTGDWHIGKRLYGNDRLDETQRVLSEVAQIARDHEVDAILVAGDNLDRRLVEPPVLATCLGALEELAGVAPVVAVTGNHEDPLFWAQIAPYLAPRIRLAAADAVFPVDTRAGRLYVGCLPWPEPAEVAADPGTDRTSSRVDYAAYARGRIDGLAAELRGRRRESGGVAILLGHLMVSHGVAGGGERELTLGGTYAVDGGALPSDLDYVALGHLHRPQPLPGFTGLGRYAGSPMALDFSGDGTAPSVAIIDITGGRTAAREVPLTTGRRLVRLRGSLDEIARQADAHPGAWFFCEVVVDQVRLDLVRHVRDRIPDALRVEPIVPGGAPQIDADAQQLTQRDLGEVYGEWLETSGRGRDDRLIAAFRAALAHVESQAD